MEIENQEQEILMEPEYYLGTIGLVNSVNGMTGDVVLTAVDVDALPNTTKYAASISLTLNSQNYVLSAQLLDQDGNNIGQAQSIDLPLESMIINGEYDDDTKNIILTLNNGQTISFSVADLVSGLQTEITSSNKLSSDLVDDTDKLNKFVNQTILDYLNKFFNSSATTTNTGSNITLNNTLNAKLDSVELYGDIEQNGTPTPDSPIPVQTVTGEQTVTVRGKNSIDLETISRTSNGITGLSDAYTGITILSGTATATAAAAMNNNYTIEIKSGQTYTFSANNPVANSNVRLSLYAGNGVYPISFDLNSINATTTFTANADYMCRPQWRVISGTTLTNFKIEAMLEQGSTATTYAPYQSQLYTFSLGPIELCKIGNYQDYIYKSGDDWYIHKEIGKAILTGSEDETWTGGNNNIYFYHTITGAYQPENRSTIAAILCDYYTPRTYNQVASTTIDYGIALDSNNAGRLAIRNKDCANSTAFKTWLASNNTTVYYAFATPTDTKITDNILIGQLEALANANSYLGITNFVVTATGTNLPALLEVVAYTQSLDGISEALSNKQDQLIAGQNITIVNNVISSTGGGGGGSEDFTLLTDADANYTDVGQTDWIAIWELATGAYKLDRSATIDLALTAEDDYVTQSVGANQTPFLLVDNDGDYVRASIWCNDATYLGEVEISSGNGSFRTFITEVENFIGTDGEDDGYAGLVPAPTTSDVDKYLKSDGTWASVGGGGPTVVQTTGTSTTDVMSQDATTKLVYPDIANYPYRMGIGESSILTSKALAINGIINSGINSGSIAIGSTDGSQAQIGQNGRADLSVAIGNAAGVGRGSCSVAIGGQAFANSGQNTGDNVALGYNSYAGSGLATSTVALGAYAKTTRTGEVNIGTGSNGTGYNSTNYRVLGGVHDGQLAQDAATVAQVNATIDAINTALSTNIPHIGT